MNRLALIKISGHPLFLFGESKENSEKRYQFLKHFFFRVFSISNSKHKKKFLNKSIKAKWSFSYFWKIEIRKKNYQNSWKVMEVELSKKGIHKCLVYGKIDNTKKVKNEKEVCFDKFLLLPVYRLIFKIPWKCGLFCFQTGDSGFFFIKEPEKIFLNDLKTKKITCTLQSNLIGINKFSPHPDFPLCFFVSNEKSSEFWKIPSFSSHKASVNYIYHKDFINFQKYRNHRKLIDFGTVSMKWKCFDEIVQKYIFSYQFNENIINISTNENNNLTAVHTIDQLHIFDNRINKKITVLRLNSKRPVSMEWTGEELKFFNSSKRSVTWDKLVNKIQTKSEIYFKIPDVSKFVLNSKFTFSNPKKNWIKIVQLLSKEIYQSIKSKNEVSSLKSNHDGTMLGINNNKELAIFQLR